MLPRILHGQPVEEGIRINPLTEEGFVEWDYEHDLAVGTNGVIVRYGNGVLTAESVAVDQNSGEVTADGRVRIRREDEIWVGEHVQYNFFTRRIECRAIPHRRSLRCSPRARRLHFDTTNQVYSATNAIITADDVMQPGVKIRAKYVEIIPGRRITARERHAVRGGGAGILFPLLLPQPRPTSPITSISCPACEALSGRISWAATPGSWGRTWMAACTSMPTNGAASAPDPTSITISVPGARALCGIITSTTALPNGHSRHVPHPQ